MVHTFIVFIIIVSFITSVVLVVVLYLVNSIYVFSSSFVATEDVVEQKVLHGEHKFNFKLGNNTTVLNLQYSLVKKLQFFLLLMLMSAKKKIT